MSQMKYVILSDGAKEYPIVFGRELAHIDVANGIIRESAVSKWSKIMGRLTPVAAGFVYLPDLSVDDSSHSESLKLSARPQDQEIIRGSSGLNGPLIVSVADGPVRITPKPASQHSRSLLERARGGRGRL